MKVKALTSFAGPVTMFGGEIKDITDDKVLNDLIKCGYVEAVEELVSQPPAGGAEDGATGEEDNAAGGAEDGAATPPVKGSRKSAAKSNNK